MNLCVFVGRLVQDINVKVFTKDNGETKVANFSLAIPRFFKKKDGELEKETDFLDFEIWNTGAETLAKHAKKGDQILVEGNARQETWEQDGEEGKKIKRSRVRFKVERFEFLNSKRGNGEEKESKKPAKQTAESNSDAEIPF